MVTRLPAKNIVQLVTGNIGNKHVDKATTTAQLDTNTSGKATDKTQEHAIADAYAPA